MRSAIVTAIAVVLTFSTAPPRGVAQVPVADSAGWNTERAVHLVDRARERRLVPARDTALRNYTAHADGFVYFYLDRRGSTERTLVKTDQIALELYWQAPGRTLQRIVGLRDESRFPNRMHYHLDHLTVVQNGFGDMIRMGDGDEVRDVPHPAAPGADTIYDYRLADSLTIQLPSGPPIRVYELQVRPRRTDRPALVGSIYVDRATADVVRMTFTFTPVSYVDHRLDHITVSLDNGLWDGRYWLPNEQTLLIRRQLPELDFAASAVIQGRMRIGGYTFNDSIPPETFIGPAVEAAPESARRAYPFERSIHDDLDEAGLAPAPDLDEVRREAARMLGEGGLSGLPALRLGYGSASSALRFNRAEGLSVGAGLVYTRGSKGRMDIGAGYRFGAEQPWADAAYSRDAEQHDVAVGFSLRGLRDLGVAPGVPAGLNTLAAVLLGDDYLDPWYATGGWLRYRRSLGRELGAALLVRAERHASATLTEREALIGGSDPFRPVRRIDEGDLSSVAASLVRTAPDPTAAAWFGKAAAELGRFAGAWYLRPELELGHRWSTAGRFADLVVRGAGGMVLGTPPSQRLFVLGGTGTLPGYEYRDRIGTRYVLLDGEASVALLDPWIRLRVIGAVGATGGLSSASPATGGSAWHGWGVATDSALRASAGVGASLLWDLIRVDWIRGLSGGEWKMLLSIHPDFADIS